MELLTNVLLNSAIGLTELTLISSLLVNITSILIVAVGLGMVIFFHELGHFAVAKWCNVNVERFSIGLGPIILAKKIGETEYALSLIPFGGYVKMLGQDDADPGQMTDDDIASDPRSYTAKSVPQRMAIISAGVIMNVITGLGFFSLAFGLGVEAPPAELGHVKVGDPAWEAGLQVGDRITRINGKKVSSFKDILRSTILSSRDSLELDGIHPDGETFSISVTPERVKTRRMIGVGFMHSLTMIEFENKDYPPAEPGSAAAKTSFEFQQGDRIVKIDGEPVSEYVDYLAMLAKKRSEPVELTIERMGEEKQKTTEVVTIPANPMRTLGLRVDIGQVAAIQKGSPAAAVGFKVGDKIVRVDEVSVGMDLNPVALPEVFRSKAGQEVEVVVKREESGSGSQELTFKITPNHRWRDLVEVAAGDNVPLSIPSIGLAFHLLPTVLKVEEGSPSDGKIQPLERITKVEFPLPEGRKFDAVGDQQITLELGEDHRNWAYAVAIMQQARQRPVKLHVKNESGEDRVVELTPMDSRDMFLTERGFHFQVKTIPLKADDIGQAFVMGLDHTRDSAEEVYLTLRSLFTQKVSVTELHGPVGIAKVAFQVASEGLSDFVLFLGFLSINLAVLNFLPIPVLDGGHMVFLIWEGVTGKPPSERVFTTATYIGLTFVLSLMLFVIYLDISRHFQ